MILKRIILTTIPVKHVEFQLKRGKLNIYLECQSWLWETNYQPVIFDKSFRAELEEFVI